MINQLQVAEEQRNQLVFIENKEVVTDSLMVAEVFGKEHRDVLKAIDNLTEETGEWGLRNFTQTQYLHEQNKQKYRKFLIRRDGLNLLVMGFTGKTALEYKLKFIQAFNDMEHQLQQLYAPSYTIMDPIERAKRWIQEQEERQELETKTLLLEQTLAEAERKITYMDTILESKDALLMTQIAEDYGMTANRLNRILEEERVQRKVNGQWILYAEHKGKGYTSSKTHQYNDSKGEARTRLHTLWTQKGRLFIHELLEHRGIVAVMDREEVSA